METNLLHVADLNYDHYCQRVYDDDIVRAIPGHVAMHRHIAKAVRDTKNLWTKNRPIRILDLGAGTGLTSAVIYQALPFARFTLLDFSQNMLRGAKQRLADAPFVSYVHADYSVWEPSQSFDIIVSVVGIHHQTTEGKWLLFERIAEWLEPDGIFIFGDLFTYRNRWKTRLAKAMHYRHLVKRARSIDQYHEWAYHHMYLNNAEPLEDQLDWLRSAGLLPCVHYRKHQTALLIARKPAT